MHPCRIGLKNRCLTRIEAIVTGSDSSMLPMAGPPAKLRSTHLKNERIQRAIVGSLLMKLFLAICLFCFFAIAASAAGVTVITHGLNGNATGWVTGMANKIPAYYRFTGTNYSFYMVYFVANGSGYNTAWS